MSEDFIEVPPDSSGKKVRALKRTVGANDVYEEGMVIIDPATGNTVDPRQIRALTSADIVTVLKSGTWNIDNLLNPHPTDPSDRVARLLGSVSLGVSSGKTVVMKTGSLVTTATTADQVILTYTVTAGKTFYLEYFRVDTRLTTFATTATYFGLASLENPSGTKLITQMQAGAGITVLPPLSFDEPIPIVAGTVIRVVCTPSSTTSYTWQANFGGYEK